MNREEARAGGLIDRYFIFNWILLPLLLILTLIGCLYLIGKLLECPYIEDVSLCFPHNLPTWAKICLPVLLSIAPIIILIWLHKLNKGLDIVY